MTNYFREAKATHWLVAGLLSGLAGCGSTREVTTTSPSSAATSAAQPIAAADYATVRANRPATPARPANTLPMPVFRAQPRPAEAEPTGSAPAAPARPGAPRVAPKVTRTQSGRIIDEAGQPLVGATVLLKGTTRGASTDADGNYSLEVPAGLNTFVFGYSGYQDEVAESRDGQPLTVTLLPEATVAAPPVAPPRKKHH